MLNPSGASLFVDSRLDTDLSVYYKTPKLVVYLWVGADIASTLPS